MKAGMDAGVRRLFERYERFFEQGLRGDADMDELTSVYASSFIAASPAGVMAGSNDEQFRAAMTGGYAHYRAIGTTGMRIRDVRISPIDDLHCVAHVAWMATYARPDAADVGIDFEVHYLVQMLDDQPKIFGWVTGDEQAVLKEHGIG